MIHK